MTSQSPADNDPFGGLTVDRVTRDDGRYLLYYSWPQPSATYAAAEPARSREPAGGTPEPWTPEAGPVAERDDV